MKVKCIESKAESLVTAGKIYDVVSVPGDVIKAIPLWCIATGRETVPEGSLEIVNDAGLISFINVDRKCNFGKWKVLQ